MNEMTLLIDAEEEFDDTGYFGDARNAQTRD
jgi:hypothetical protein